MTLIKKSKFWKNPWTIGIVGSIVATLILKLVDLITGFSVIPAILNFIKSSLNSFISFLGKSYLLPVWAMILIFISPLAIICILAIISHLVYKGRPVSNPERPDFIDYTTDKFDGL